MQNDAKLGLILGIVMVMVVAVVFFRRDQPPSDAASAAIAPRVSPTSPAPAANLPGPNMPRPDRSPLGHTVSRTDLVR